MKERVVELRGKEEKLTELNTVTGLEKRDIENQTDLVKYDGPSTVAVYYADDADKRDLE